MVIYTVKLKNIKLNFEIIDLLLLNFIIIANFKIIKVSIINIILVLL